jgi:hypothetical protein
MHIYAFGFRHRMGTLMDALNLCRSEGHDGGVGQMCGCGNLWDGLTGQTILSPAGGWWWQGRGLYAKFVDVGLRPIVFYT